MASAFHTFEFKWAWADANKWDSYSNLKIADKRKIRIAPGQPINTSVFEEPIVLEYNGVPTIEGLKERAPLFSKEGDLKPIIDCLFRW